MKYPSAKGKQHSFETANKYPFFTIPILGILRNAMLGKLLKNSEEGKGRYYLEGNERRDSRQPQRNSIDRGTRVYIFRGELNCSQNALVTETSENLVQWFLAV